MLLIEIKMLLWVYKMIIGMKYCVSMRSYDV